MNSTTHTDAILLKHIRNECLKIIQLTNKITYEDFKQDTLYQDAIIRRLEIIGEAAGNLSENYSKNHPQLPIRDMKAMRNILAHQYFKVDLDYVWKTIITDIPEILTIISE